MTPEVWTIIGVGIVLATLTLASNRRLEVRLERRMDRIESRMKDIETEVNGLGKEVAHLSGVVQGLREAIAHNRAA